MKILAFGDTHGEEMFLEALHDKAQKVDLIICLGDHTIFGADEELMLFEINELNKPILLIHGNHEFPTQTQQLCKAFSNITYMHKKCKTIQDYSFIMYGGDGFSTTDKEFETFVAKAKNKCKNNTKTILITHGPPSNTTIDVPFEDHHSGNESYRIFIEEFQPLLSLAGHIHEGEHLQDTIEQTLVLNPGPDGEIIDLDKLHTERKKSLEQSRRKSKQKSTKKNNKENNKEN